MQLLTFRARPPRTYVINCQGWRWISPSKGHWAQSSAKRRLRRVQNPLTEEGKGWSTAFPYDGRTRSQEDSWYVIDYNELERLLLNHKQWYWHRTFRWFSPMPDHRRMFNLLIYYLRNQNWTETIKEFFLRVLKLAFCLKSNWISVARQFASKIIRIIHYSNQLHEHASSLRLPIKLPKIYISMVLWMPCVYHICIVNTKNTLIYMCHIETMSFTLFINAVRKLWILNMK